MNDIDAVSLQDASDGTVFLTIRKENGYADEYRMEPREAKYLFNKFGDVLQRVGEEQRQREDTEE